ncbi:MAG: glycosyltransferase family 4 protein [Candidatus Methylacidiphilales bacterium]|nr:glycosyltransferase family 4 protein [Candidatus Methylacidiphilales bacterium]
MKIAIITSHPVQYYAPWFRYLAGHGTDLRVFYLWDFGVKETHDPGFARSFQWDIPLLDGYEHEFVPNVATDPGTHHPGGLDNPELQERVAAWNPGAVLLMGYSWKSMREFILSRKRHRTPLLLRGDSHDLARPRGLRTAAARLAAGWIFRHLDAFLACGQANTEYFLNRGVRRDRIFFCPHTIDDGRFQRTPAVLEGAASLRLEWGLPPDTRVVLFAGKFEEKKRPLDLLQAFRMSGVKNAHLVYVGSGPLETRLRDEIGTDPKVRVFPFQNQSQMPVVYAATDLLVLPSYGPSETWGLAIQEALACGLPVIASSHTGCARDLIQLDRNGLVFPAGDVASLARALTRALEPGILASWIPFCRSALERYNHEQAARGLAEAVTATRA